MDRAQLENLFPSQADLITAGFLESDDNWVICAHTGAGKTKMAEWAIQSALDKGYRGAYLAPLKAIVEERVSDWATNLSHWEIGLYTGDTTRKSKQQRPHQESVLLFTPEKLSAYLQNWKKHLTWLADLDVVVIDELHLLGDTNRGSTLETMVGRLQRINPFIRFVGLSGTLSNAEEIANWLKARLFKSDWRPVPIKHRIQRFKRVTDKREIALEEIQSTLNDKGQILIFVNSRRRAESLVQFLVEQGIKAGFNHAGLSREDRNASQKAMRQGEIDVMVSTSTLEMGVNFPARKVIIYDAYAFDGERFQPLSIQRYRQYAGRAGRAGYDEHGETVLLLANWHRDGEQYLTAQPEPVRSALFDTQNLLREVLCEIGGRLSISQDHLETNFAERSLWRKQDGRKSLSLHVQHLITAGLVKEREKNDRVYLSTTALGRIGSQMSLSPQTVTLLADFFHTYPEPSTFDILLIACLCREATPKLGFNFEEIDHLGDTVLEASSRLLDTTADWFLQPGRGIDERTLLASLKGATLLHQHASGATLDSLAQAYDLYPSDLGLLKTHLGWVLDSASRIFGVLSTPKTTDDAEEEPASTPPHQMLAMDLKKMVEYGIPRESLSLTRVPGIGPKRAQVLVANGILTTTALTKAEPGEVAGLLRLREATAAKLIDAASEVDVATTETQTHLDEPKGQSTKPRSIPSWPPDVDPYRLRRALELEVAHASIEIIRVTGGSEPHQIAIHEDPFRERSYACDCIDFAKGSINCKHILRARLEHNDQQLLGLLNSWKDLKPKEIRYSLAELWIRSGRVFDAYNGRNVDYQGNRFLARIQKRRVSR